MPKSLEHFLIHFKNPFVLPQFKRGIRKIELFIEFSIGLIPLISTRIQAPSHYTDLKRLSAVKQERNRLD